jgi:predicted nucleotidyltransferase
MTVVNEKSRVPPLDKAALERLSHALDHEGAVAAMLIGSQARGTVGPLSDVDIAALSTAKPPRRCPPTPSI